MGKKKQPHYRIVVTDTRAPRDGRFVEILGYYNPIHHPAALSVDLERVDHWVGRGAIVSSTVGSLVSKARAGGDDSVALVGAGADGDAGVDVAAVNGAAAEAATAAGSAAVAEADAAAEAADPAPETDADGAAEDDAGPAAEAEADAAADADAADEDGSSSDDGDA